MNITSDSNCMTDKKHNTSDQDTAAGSSYSAMALKPLNLTGEASQSRHIVPKQGLKNVPIPKRLYLWTDKVREIIKCHKTFTRIMIIMRGAPGSGKSSLAREVVEVTVGSSYIDYNTHIFSADDYFMLRGKYIFNKYKLSEAHLWNQKRVKMATRQGLSPIIVDNTNIELWEMEPYVREGVKQGYIIEVLEPSTPWAWNISELSKRNIHNVPKVTISRMLENYCHDITGEMLKDTFAISYPVDKAPPVLRTVPIFASETHTTASEVKASKPLGQTSLNSVQDEKSKTEPIEQVAQNLVGIVEFISEPGCSKEQNLIKQKSDKKDVPDLKPIISEEVNLLYCEQSDNNDDEFVVKDKLFLEAQKRLEELQKDELEWELNEGWDTKKDANDDRPQENTTTCIIKPKRSRRTIDKVPILTEKFKDSINKSEDWSSFSMFMTPWNDPNKEKESENTSETNAPVEKLSCSTYMEMGDMDPNNGNNYKIITASPRNINEFYIPFNKEKIPDRRMLDKSSMTNENTIKQYFRCQNEEKHFSSFKKIFPKVPKGDLRDIFEKCHGDVNWAVDIVFDSLANELLHTVEDEDLSDLEEDNLEQCQCVSAYNIIPDGQIISPSNSDPNPTDFLNVPGCSTSIVSQSKKKIKKDVSDSSMLLKSQIEQNVVISDKHYSEHCLKIKKIRRGEIVRNEDISEHSCNSDSQEIVPIADSNENTKTQQSDDEESNISLDDFEKVVPINVGMDFVGALDGLFGRSDMIYPPNVKPKMTIRSSLLNELNAVWMESLMNQLEDEAVNANKRDEELARELAMKEAELLRAGKEPAVPDFKEIMDMQLALNLYQKDVDEWKNNQPKDLAAKLSREKLCHLFPDVSQDTLMELLMAHDNNFQTTVEVLLHSMGKTDILKTANGVNKFILEKEMQRQKKVLEEERKTLNEFEWPLLMKGETIDMSVVHGYRQEAERHLQRTNTHFNKAQEYVHRGMTLVASFYSEMVSYHRQRYEQANSLAAMSLIQMHAANNPDTATIDLHYLHVSEARESLDIFIDTHIQKLKESQSKGGPRVITLFFITGRGLHSSGGPRIKPAVKKRLRERGLTSTERNPGLLTAKVTADDRMSHEIRKG